jgi:tRNA pseudouridine55 synthase
MSTALRRTRVGPVHEDSAITLEKLENLSIGPRLSEALLPVETALDDIPALAVTDEDAFRLAQGRAIVLLPRQVETLKAAHGTAIAHRFSHGGRDRLVALCEMRAGRLNPVRVFQLT